jgi:ADP-glucose pyrophosphorylase
MSTKRPALPLLSLPHLIDSMDIYVVSEDAMFNILHECFPHENDFGSESHSKFHFKWNGGTSISI